tara:strand:- start:2560 stop:2865 length:306 start_codon:yes stop_codon:yes gene_type:complete
MGHLLDQIEAPVRSNGSTPPLTCEIMNVSRRGASIDELSARVRVEGHEALRALFEGGDRSAERRDRVKEAADDETECERGNERIAYEFAFNGVHERRPPEG